MTISKGNTVRSMKWLIALVLFVLALTVTFSDVYGNPADRTDGRDINGNTSRYPDSKPPADDPNGTMDDPQGSSPEAVPEPATLILLGSGLAAMYTMRRRLRK